MIRYVTKWDGTPRTLENIRFVLKVQSYDNRYSIRMDEYEDLHIEAGNGRGLIVPKGWDVVIPQEGRMYFTKDSMRLEI